MIHLTKLLRTEFLSLIKMKQKLNVDSLMDLTESGIETFNNETHQHNVDSFIVVIVDGISISVKDEHSLKADDSIEFIE